MAEHCADQPGRHRQGYVSQLTGATYTQTYCLDCGVVVIRVDAHDMFHRLLDGEQEASDDR